MKKTYEFSPWSPWYLLQHKLRWKAESTQSTKNSNLKSIRDIDGNLMDICSTNHGVNNKTDSILFR